jgi:hypothetical protein
MGLNMRQLSACALVLVCLCQTTGWCDDEPAAEPPAKEEAAAAVFDFVDEVILEADVVELAPAPAPAKEGAAAVEIDFDFQGIVVDVVQQFFPAPAPAPARLEPARVAQIEAQIKQILPHFVQQLQPVLAAELAFIRQFCDVPKEVRPKIKAAGEASLQQAARALAGQQFQNDGNLFGRGNPRSDPRQLIAEALSAAVKEHLSAEQFAMYSAESAKRTARRKEAAILCAVSRLDESLWLTIKQREQISAAIAANWQGKWEQWVLLHRYGGMYFPVIPDEHVVFCLNEEQKSVWNGLQKVDFGGWGGFEGQVPEDDGWWGDEPAKQAEAAGAILAPVNVLRVR